MTRAYGRRAGGAPTLLGDICCAMAQYLSPESPARLDLGSARKWNDANVLALGYRLTADELARRWLTPF